MLRPFDLSINVFANDVYLFPTLKRGNRHNNNNNTVTDSFPLDETDSDLRLLQYDGEPTISYNKYSDQHALVYAFCDIRVSGSSSSSSPTQIPNRLKSLTLSLIGRQQIAFPNRGIENTQTLLQEKQITEAIDLTHLEIGKMYRFERCFFIDHSAAPFQKCIWGSNTHKVVAKATYHGFFARPQKAETKIHLIDCQSNKGSDMLWHEKSVRGSTEGIGAFALHTHSNVFTVGGYVRVSFESLEIEPKMQLVGFRSYFEQRCTLRSRRRRRRGGDGDGDGEEERHVEEATPRKVLLMDLNRDKLKQLMLVKQNQEDETQNIIPAFNYLVRLPDHSMISASTVQGNRAAIRYRTTIEFDIDFIDGEKIKQPSSSSSSSRHVLVDGQKVKRFHLRWPVHIHSCACQWDSLTLPLYYGPQQQKDTLDESPPLYANQQNHHHHSCICNQQLETLLQVEKHTNHMVIPNSPSCSSSSSSKADFEIPVDEIVNPQAT